MYKFLLVGFIWLLALVVMIPVAAPDITLAKGYSLEESLQNLGNDAKPIPLPSFLPGTEPKSATEGQAERVTGIIQNIANGLAGLAAAIAILFIVINGFRMAVSVGEQDALSKAKKGLVWSCGGLVLVIFSYIIAKTVISFTYLGPEAPSPVISTEQSLEKVSDDTFMGTLELRTKFRESLTCEKPDSQKCKDAKQFKSYFQKNKGALLDIIKRSKGRKQIRIQIEEAFNQGAEGLQKFLQAEGTPQ